jgi:O-methyltransferase
MEIPLIDVQAALDRVRPFTMVPTASLENLAEQVLAVLQLDIPGSFVECGVWRGGASFLMADLLRQAGVSDRKVWLFDSFEGLPAPEPIDGERARKYVADKDRANYHDNCRASLEEVHKAAAELEISSFTEMVKGWFDQTLPANRDRLGRIAILRIDADWYSSVLCCLENLYDSVVEGGLIVFDDYYTYDGCAMAVHDFLGRRKLAHPLESIPGRPAGEEDYLATCFRKGKSTWKWLHWVCLAKRQIEDLVPLGSRYILVGGDTFDAKSWVGRRARPLFERDGVDWGPPPDDATAIREVNQLREIGVSFIVFAWPAFWWLRHYSDFGRFLRTEFRCVLESDLAVVFDLRKTGVRTLPSGQVTLTIASETRTP